MGAGSVGGFYGAHLLNAGRDVTFLVRPKRAQHLRDDGLHLLAPSGDVHIEKPSTLTAESLRTSPTPCDLVLLSCKAYGLDTAMEDLAPAVGAQTLILPLLNGIAHMQKLDDRFGRSAVLGGDTTVSAGIDESGRILHLNPLDSIQFGDRDDPDSSRIHAVHQVLSVRGVTADLRPNIMETMWHKWVTISTAASATCLLRANVGDVVAAGCSGLVHQILEETAGVSAAEGYPVPQTFRDVIIGKFTQPNSMFTASMFRDIEARRPIEEHQIVGDLLLHARRRLLSTPILDIVHAHLLCYEARRKRELVPPSEP